MESRIGSILRQARSRRRIELSEVESATRIRARFLRAIESEEWDALPGGFYTRGFIRTYASFLGLDGARLAEEYRKGVEGSRVGEPGSELAPVVASSATGSPGGRRARPRLAWLAVPGAVLVGAIAVVALPRDAGDGDGVGLRPLTPQRSEPAGAGGEPTPTAHTQGVSLRLSAAAEVWVCLLSGAGQPLVDGEILEAGAEEGPFRSGSFTVSFGNGEVSMLIDGVEAEIPATASPIGYSIDPEGELTELGEAERPTCT
jgi:cytoskeleton protein RodZ